MNAVGIDENELYATAWDELEAGNKDKGMWVHALVDADGDEEKARLRYLKNRVEQMKVVMLKEQQEKELRKKEMVKKESYAEYIEQGSNTVLGDYINLKDNSGYTPLMRAIMKKDVEAVKNLLEDGARTDVGFDGQSVLRLAKIYKNEEIINLIQYKAF